MYETGAARYKGIGILSLHDQKGFPTKMERTSLSIVAAEMKQAGHEGQQQ